MSSSKYFFSISNTHHIITGIININCFLTNPLLIKIITNKYQYSKIDTKKECIFFYTLKLTYFSVIYSLAII